MEEKTKNLVKRILSTVAFIAVLVVLGFAMIASKVEPKSAEKAWYTEMSVGNPEAKNHFIIYSDIMCPYCVAFENAIFENEQEFEEYIKENDILIEVRIADFLYEYGEARAINSRYSALGTYCAKNEGKFWDYYKLAITTVWKDYFSKSGKNAFSSLNAKDKDYWIALGKKLELSESFESCVKNDEPLEEIMANAKKMTKLVSGMPYFKFNKYTSSGFDLSWGWDYVKMYFEAGLES
jgi:protein-disulfide isomerase